MFIASIILALIAIGLWIAWFKSGDPVTEERPVVPDPAEEKARASGVSYAHRRTQTVQIGVERLPALLVSAIITSVMTVAGLALSMIYTQSVGEAKVIVNWGGTVAGVDSTSGFGVKAPWQTVVNFDLFSQTLTYAGTDKAPDYTGGKVNGQEITSNVQGGAQANMDVQITYNLDPSHVIDLYKQFRSQERFTQQIVNQRVLSTIRAVPPNYDAISFRGEKRAEAQTTMQQNLAGALSQYGVDVQQVSLQDIRYNADVEQSIQSVQVAQQKQAESEALQRAATVDAQTAVIKAQGEANAVIEKAKGDAQANDLIAKSLSPEVLQQHYFDAISQGKETFIVPQGTAPLVSIPAAK